MKKQISAVILVGLMLFSVFGCSDSGDVPDDGSETSVSEISEETAAESVIPPLELPEKDFNGKTVRVAVPSQGDFDGLYTAEETGEIVNDAVFYRGRMMQENYNINLEVFYDSSLTPTDSFIKMIRQTVASGEDRFELVFNWCYGGGNLAIEGNFIDWYTIPNINWEGAHWPQNTIREMTVYNKMFTVVSSITTSMLSNAKVIWFNKKLMDSYDLKYPYDMVREGKWTLDAIMSMTRDVYGDVNGNGKRDLEDTYGYCSIPDNHGYVISTDTPILRITEDGGREIAVMSEKTQTLVDKMYNWYYENEGVYLGNMGAGDADNYSLPFTNGRALMMFGYMNTSSSLRYTDVIYGVVPHPKFDEDQEKYYSFTRPDIISVPITCSDTDLAGFFMEAMTYYGYYDVVTAYYETVLQGKIADAPEDAEMMQIVNDSLTVSFPYNYENFVGFSNLWGLLRFQKNSGSKDLASIYEKNLKAAQKRLDLVLEGFSG